MKKQIIYFLIILSASIITVSQCKRTLTGWGDDANIQVLADSTHWIATESILRSTFEKPIVTPQDETIFTLIKGDVTKFKRFKNILFVGTLDGEGEISTIIKNSLSSEAKQKVLEGEYVFIQKEKWATSQLIMFLIATDINQLQQKIAENKYSIFNLYDSYWNEVVTKQMFIKGEQFDVEKYLLNTYAWMVKVQYEYEIFIENKKNNFVMLRRQLPERWFFIHWIEDANPDTLTKEWCIKTRDMLGNKFYEGDQLEQKFVQPKCEEVDFLGRRAYRIEGLWRNDEKRAGGPVINYSFYDEKSRRIYMLDYAIFSPRQQETKRRYLRQAEIFLKTFKTKYDLSEKKLISTRE